MKTIEVTQFLRPDGQQRAMFTEVSDKAFSQYEKIRALGLFLTAAVFETGHVSICIEDFKLGVFDSFLCLNGPDVLENLEIMLLRFHDSVYQSWANDSELHGGQYDSEHSGY